MTTKIMLRQMVNLKLLISIFVINLLNDVIAIGLFKKLNTNIISSDSLYYLFNRYFCTDISFLSFAMYISLVGIIVFKVINCISCDNQKSGIFFITRMTRQKYFTARMLSIIIFTACVCAEAILQSFISQRVMGIIIEKDLYYNIFSMLMITVMCANFIGVCMCSATKEPRISFLLSFSFLTAFSIYISLKEILVPTINFMAIQYIYPGCPIFIFIALFGLITTKQDFITTKIKE